MLKGEKSTYHLLDILLLVIRRDNNYSIAHKKLLLQCSGTSATRDKDK